MLVAHLMGNGIGRIGIAFMKHLFPWLYIQMIQIVESKQNIHKYTWYIMENQMCMKTKIFKFGHCVHYCG